MKLFKLDGVDGVFLHLETDVEINMTYTVMGSLLGSGEFRTASSKVFDCLREIGAKQLNRKGTIHLEDTLYEFK